MEEKCDQKNKDAANGFFISLLKSGLTGEPVKGGCSIADDDNVLKTVYRLSVMHGVGYLISKALEENGFIDNKSPSYPYFKKQKTSAIYKSELYKIEETALKEKLNAEGVDFIFLKGQNLRSLYPLEYMRSSCDIDILVREQDLSRAVIAIKEIGYTDKGKKYHDITFVKDGRTGLELHFSIKENIEAIDALLDKAWKYAVKKENHEYEFTPEFFLFYFVAHTSYHFYNGGCGIRPFMDLFYLQRKFAVNGAKLDEMLSMCGIDMFYRYAVALSEFWFGDGENDPLFSELERYILSGGAYGTVKNKISVQSKNGKSSYILKRIFMPYKQLCIKYPSLNGKKLLTPLYQIRRWLSFILKRDKKGVKAELKANNTVDDEIKERAKRLIAELCLFSDGRYKPYSGNKIVSMLFYLLSCGVKQTVPDEVRIKELSDAEMVSVLNLAQNFRITPLVCDALLRCTLSDKFREFLSGELGNAVVSYEQKQYALDSIAECFNKNGVPFIPLKGAVINKLYPLPYLRTSLDLDIFVPKKYLNKAVYLLQTELKYTYDKRTSHDEIFVVDGMFYLELHFSLIEKFVSKKVSSIMKRVWDYSKTENGSFYSMNDEMFYFYQVAHMAKHIKQGGCGLRQFIDLYILNNCVKFSAEKREKLLAEGNLTEFNKTAVELANYIIDGKSTGKTAFSLCGYVLKGGQYGTEESRQTATELRPASSKFSLFMLAVFPNYKQMENMYPSLKRHKWAYPFYMIYRWISKIFSGRVFKRLFRRKTKTVQGKVDAEKTGKLIKDLKI